MAANMPKPIHSIVPSATASPGLPRRWSMTRYVTTPPT